MRGTPNTHRSDGTGYNSYGNFYCKNSDGTPYVEADDNHADCENCEHGGYQEPCYAHGGP